MRWYQVTVAALLTYVSEIVAVNIIINLCNSPTFHHWRFSYIERFSFSRQQSVLWISGLHLSLNPPSVYISISVSYSAQPSCIRCVFRNTCPLLSDYLRPVSNNFSRQCLIIGRASWKLKFCFGFIPGCAEIWFSAGRLTVVIRHSL